MMDILRAFRASIANEKGEEIAQAAFDDFLGQVNRIRKDVAAQAETGEDPPRLAKPSAEVKASWGQVAERLNARQDAEPAEMDAATKARWARIARRSAADE